MCLLDTPEHESGALKGKAMTRHREGGRVGEGKLLSFEVNRLTIVH